LTYHWLSKICDPVITKADLIKADKGTRRAFPFHSQSIATKRCYCLDATK